MEGNERVRQRKGEGLKKRARDRATEWVEKPASPGRQANQAASTCLSKIGRSDRGKARTKQKAANQSVLVPGVLS